MQKKKKSIVKQFVRMKSILSNNIKPFTQKKIAQT